jgi:hypothetical protein
MRYITIPPGAVSEIIATSADSGLLILADRHGLMAAILDEFINDDEALNRLLLHVIRSPIQLIDQISYDR